MRNCSLLFNQTNHKTFCSRIICIIIYQSSYLSSLCVSLVESVSREIGEIRLSPSHQRAREIMHYLPVNNKKITCAITRTRDLWTAKNRECFVNHIVYRIKFNVFFRKLIKYFMYFRMKFALFFRFLHSWYIIKYLLTETLGKQYVLWTLDCRCQHRQSRVHKTYCFLRSQNKQPKNRCRKLYINN